MPKEEWRAGLTVDGLIADLDKALQFPGVSNAWTMPIKARTDMLATGIRTPVGIKVLGTDLNELDRLARQIEAVVKTVPGTSSAYAERVIGGYYLDVVPDREALARRGITELDGEGEVASGIALQRFGQNALETLVFGIDDHLRIGEIWNGVECRALQRIDAGRAT